MNQNTFPFPEPQPLTRLNTHNDLKINAERWELAHSYHRQRQNVIHQSLWEPGIIYGLGVKVIPHPEHASPQFRDDNRWIEIQPGIAIDVQGNPIIVRPEPIEDRMLRVAIPAPNQGSINVKIVIRYVDPDNLEIPSTRDRVVEPFRLDQITRDLEPSEIELCRIEIEREITLSKDAKRDSQSAKDIRLNNPINPLSPRSNELDLRYRKFVQMRAQSTIELKTHEQSKHSLKRGLSNLASSFSSLYPKLGCTIQNVDFADISSITSDFVQIIYLSRQELFKLIKDDNKKCGILQQFLQENRGTIIVEIRAEDPQNSDFQELLYRLTNRSSLEELKVKDYTTAVLTIPFLFGILPRFAEAETTILGVDNNIILITSPLSSAWYGKDMQRHEIRDAQELGINLLTFCWNQMYQHSLLK